MPKKIDPVLKSRAVRLVADHQGEYSSMTAACEAVGKQLGFGTESVRRWVVQAQVDAGQRPGVSSEENEEIRRPKAENRRLREDVAILKAAAALVLRISFARSSSATRFFSERTSSDSATLAEGGLVPPTRSASLTQLRSVAGFRSNNDPT